MYVSVEATEACLEKAKKPTSVEMKSEEVLRKEAAVKPVRLMKKRHVDRHLAVGCPG
jgi:hypothetical protein